MVNNVALELKNITKTFGSVVANKNVNLVLEKGEILSLLGENGSGKTTLMNMISGIYYPDEGEIFIDGKKTHITSPQDAFNYKIGMIHQHFKLVDVFSAADNILLGEKMPKYSISENAKKTLATLPSESIIKEVEKEGKKSKTIDFKVLGETLLTYLKVAALPFVKVGKFIKFDFLAKNRAKVLQEVADKYGFEIDLNKKIYDMSVSEKQTVEIIKVLYRGAEILILDEPTAVLTPQEIEKLFDVL
ncbi:MAG: ATP-binding cassette domain-containing protein, partial [Clostridia bacterium]|nr:ATP-binding cassette domain-containing protein [Clostridia bacterium]